MEKLIADAVWPYGFMSKSLTAEGSYNFESAANKVVNKIGLMSPSDYGYASIGCKRGLRTLEQYGYSTCATTNWLKSGVNEWSIMNNDSSGYYLSIDVNGYLFDTHNSVSAGIRPVVYLKSDAKIKGCGTSDSPYEIINSVVSPTSCTVYCKSPNNCTTKEPGAFYGINSNGLYGIFTCTNGKTGSINGCLYNSMQNYICNQSNDDPNNLCTISSNFNGIFIPMFCNEAVPDAAQFGTHSFIAPNLGGSGYDCSCSE